MYTSSMHQSLERGPPQNCAKLTAQLQLKVIVPDTIKVTQLGEKLPYVFIQQGRCLKKLVWPTSTVQLQIEEGRSGSSETSIQHWDNEVQQIRGQTVAVTGH